MMKSKRKRGITLDDLAGMTQRQFSALDKNVDELRSDIDELRADINDVRTNMATKDDVKASEVRVLQAVDKIATAFDKAEKDHAADKLLHDRHDKRLVKIEEKLGMK